MQFKKFLSINSISILIKLCSLFIINKLVALYLNPSWFSVINQIQQFFLLTGVVGNGGIAKGVVANLSTRNEKKFKLESLIFTLMFSFLTCFILEVMFNNYQDFSVDNNISYIIKNKNLLYISIIFQNIIVYFFSILNGYKKLSALVRFTIVQTIIQFFVLLLSILYYKNYIVTALISVNIVFGIFILYTFYFFLLKEFKRNKKYEFGNASKLLFKYSLMTVVTAICMPLLYTLLRFELSSSLGADLTGTWDALNRLSNAYLMIFTTTLSIFIIPRFTNLVNRKLIKEIFSIIKIILPIAFFALCFIYILRDNIIIFIFSSDYLNMSNLIGYQLVGDMFKIISWIGSYVLLSKRHIFLFSGMEIIFTITYYLIYRFMFEHFGEVGLYYTHAINYIAYCIAIYLILYRKYYVN